MAPQFELQDQNGTTHKLSDYNGKWVVIYFYPKDDTPGCTKEACSFQSAYEELRSMGVVVFGVSGDSVESHKKFSQKYGLDFPLLADQNKEVAIAYGAFGEKKFMGKTYQGIKRNTYVIDPKGHIVKVFEEVKPESHVQELLDFLKGSIKT